MNFDLHWWTSKKLKKLSRTPTGKNHIHILKVDISVVIMAFGSVNRLVVELVLAVDRMAFFLLKDEFDYTSYVIYY